MAELTAKRSTTALIAGIFLGGTMLGISNGVNSEESPEKISMLAARNFYRFLAVLVFSMMNAAVRKDRFSIEITIAALGLVVASGVNLALAPEKHFRPW